MSFETITTETPTSLDDQTRGLRNSVIKALEALSIGLGVEIQDYPDIPGEDTGGFKTYYVRPFPRYSLSDHTKFCFGITDEREAFVQGVGIHSTDEAVEEFCNRITQATKVRVTHGVGHAGKWLKFYGNHFKNAA